MRSASVGLASSESCPVLVPAVKSSSLEVFGIKTSKTDRTVVTVEYCPLVLVFVQHGRIFLLLRGCLSQFTIANIMIKNELQVWTKLRLLSWVIVILHDCNLKSAEPRLLVSLGDQFILMLVCRC